jgi:deoxyribodipyrimidine photo-lyase
LQLSQNTSIAEEWFPSNIEEALNRLSLVHPFQYAQTRSHLEGAVSRLSPYITHGFLSIPQVADSLYKRHRLGVQNKFIYELGWREYFQHVHSHLGDDIYKNLHPGPLPDDAYETEIPEDIKKGMTGVPVIDQSIRMLYMTGYLHNHARLWLASYLIHIRKIHWLAGANWLYGFLLDGDIASNHLSWQWVAGTGSSKPYLYNAEMISKFAPLSWLSPNTVIDQDMDMIEMIATSRAMFTQKPPKMPHVEIPPLTSEPPQGIFKNDISELEQLVGDQKVVLIHPWSLGELPPDTPCDTIKLAVSCLEFHAQHPWSDMRWHFVSQRMQAITPHLFFVSAEQLSAALTSTKVVQAWIHPRVVNWKNVNWQLYNPPKLWPHQEILQPSFSKWWTIVNQSGRHIAQLLRHRIS